MSSPNIQLGEWQYLLVMTTGLFVLVFFSAHREKKNGKKLQANYHHLKRHSSPPGTLELFPFSALTTAILLSQLFPENPGSNLSFQAVASVLRTQAIFEKLRKSLFKLSSQICAHGDQEKLEASASDKIFVAFTWTSAVIFHFGSTTKKGAGSGPLHPLCSTNYQHHDWQSLGVAFLCYFHSELLLFALLKPFFNAVVVDAEDDAGSYTHREWQDWTHTHYLLKNLPRIKSIDSHQLCACIYRYKIISQGLEKVCI